MVVKHLIQSPKIRKAIKEGKFKPMSFKEAEEFFKPRKGNNHGESPSKTCL